MRQFPQKIIERAKEHFLEHGFTEAQILRKLRIDYPDEHLPAYWTTITYWKRTDNWKESLDKKKRKETLIRRKEIIKEIVGD